MRMFKVSQLLLFQVNMLQYNNNSDDHFDDSNINKNNISKCSRNPHSICFF